MNQTYHHPESGDDERWLREAIELSRSCPQSETSFAVGAIIVAADGQCVATGYSLEFGDGWHAEQVAIERARKDGRSLDGCTIYSSLEPCSIRASGRPSCVSRILETGIVRVVFALHEPQVFVDCCGAEQLREAGIEVCVLPQLGPLVAEVNSHILDRTN